MNYFAALFLGIVQGLTEFLPISSKGHLAVFQTLMGMKEPMLFFDVMMHLGTLGAVVIFFRKDIVRLVQAIAGKQAESGEGWPGGRAAGIRYMAWIVVATIPAAAVGALFEKKVEAAFANLFLVGLFLMINGINLFFAGRLGEGRLDDKNLGWFRAILIGLAQACALLPGISRSGSTICAGMYSGMKRAAAARFSFLMAIPIMLGAAASELHHAVHAVKYVGPTLLGVFASFVVGLFALRLLVGLMRKGRLVLFAYYCWIAGAVILAASLFIQVR